MALPDILSPAFERDPYAFYKTLRDDHPFFYDEGTGSYVLSRYDDVVRALESPAFSVRNYEHSYTPIHGRTILQMDGREHAAYRNIIAHPLRPSNLRERFAKTIEDTTRALIEAFRDRGQVDLVEAFTHHHALRITTALLGLPDGDYPRVRAWATTFMVCFADLTQDPELADAGRRARAELRAYLRPVIEERRERPRDDLLSTLCAASVDGVRLTDEEISAFCSLLIDASGDSPDKVLACLFKNLIERPALLDQLREDRRLIEGALAETLRYSSPFQIVQRTTTEEVRLDVGIIPPNALVTCLLGAANRDERRFESPDTFDIHRAENGTARGSSPSARHLGFGHGRHVCVAATLSKLEMQIATDMLLDVMRDPRFTRGAPPPDEGLFVRGPRSLQISFTPPR
ncbi:MAG TPA: cytochrome P450 [Candidatus Nanopelagicales bacterium]|nr:cytochrome P450 [Candidatus Nanopelagicales bacterium]